LTTKLEVSEPHWTLDELTAMALREHPQLLAARAAESAARAASRSAKTLYLPSLSFGGGWSGSTRTTRNEAYLIAGAKASAESRISNCEATNDLYSRLARPYPATDCSKYAYSPATEAAILEANDVWPFNFTKRPPSFSVSLNMPIFNGFSREAQMQSAAASADDAKHQRREEELNRRTAVATAFTALNAAYLSVAIEERNVAAADETLQLAQERYRLGAGSILELTQAQATKARADQAQLATLYAFHENLVALEAAVGHRLR
jgi:outer membrane protein